jgi:uncharacterized protein (DUF1810 family)
MQKKWRANFTAKSVQSEIHLYYHHKMTKDFNLQRFIHAQENQYNTALAEIQQGRKQSHWMWYIFPQVKGLGSSSMAQQYAISELSEADEYLRHPILGRRLIEISSALLELKTNDAFQVFGSPDNMKLKSSMTLFASVPAGNDVFQKVLDKFFQGQRDEATLKILGL